MRRAQVSVEFFLIVTLILALAIILYTGTGVEAGRARGLDSMAETKALAERVASASDAVWFEGNQSSRVFTAFMPSSANCMYWNATSHSLYCFVIEPPALVRAQTRSPQPDFSECPAPLKAGWLRFEVRREGALVMVNCTQ